MNVVQKLAAARLAAVKKAPYLATALLNVIPREVPLGTLPTQHPTMAMTDAGILVYEAKCVETWSVQQIAAVLVHEILHWLRDHGEERRKHRDPKLWNLACDAEINDDLVAMKFDLPGAPIMPAYFGLPNGLTAEQYYPQIKAKQKPPPQPSVGAGKCGSCAGNRQEGEPPPGDKAGGKSAGRSRAEQAAIRLQVASAIRDAVKERGTVPLGLQRWANEELGEPQIPWSTKLEHAVRMSVTYRPGAVDYRYSRISRRQSAVGFGEGCPVIPALITPVPEVAIGLDTSGSMGHNDLLAAMTEAKAILDEVGAEVSFLSCDAKVHAAERVASIEDMLKLVKGGGGTDFRPIFDAVSKLQPLPEIFIFATDGCGPAPDAPPDGVAVIWLLIGRARQKPYTVTDGQPVQYGEFIEVDS